MFSAVMDHLRHHSRRKHPAALYAGNAACADFQRHRTGDKQLQPRDATGNVCHVVCHGVHDSAQRTVHAGQLHARLGHLHHDNQSDEIFHRRNAHGVH